MSFGLNRATAKACWLTVPNMGRVERHTCCQTELEDKDKDKEGLQKVYYLRKL